MRQLTDAAGAVSLAQSYAPYGDTPSSAGNGVSVYQFTGEMRDSTGFTYLRARYLDTGVGRFITRDTWGGDYQSPLSLNKWEYVEGNPVNLVDPSGYYLCKSLDCDRTDDVKWQDERKRQDALFSMVFRGSGTNGIWTRGDWEYYCTHRMSLFYHPNQWINPDTEKGWNLFALHAERLASHYFLREKTRFVRDFALLFGGIPSKGHWWSAAYASIHGPAVRTAKGERSFLYYKNSGLPSKYLDVNEAENQSHHYAGSFYLGYFAGPEAGFIASIIRDPSNPGDQLLGDQAALDAYFFRFYSSDLRDISKYISRLANP